MSQSYMNPSAFLQNVDDRIRVVEERLHKQTQYLIDAYQSQQYFNAQQVENVTVLHARLEELRILRESFVLWTQSK